MIIKLHNYFKAYKVQSLVTYKASQFHLLSALKATRQPVKEQEPATKVKGLSRSHHIISISNRREQAPDIAMRTAYVARVTEFKDARAQAQRDARRARR